MSAPRHAGLEGQRGVAALLVVVFHAYQYDRSGPAAAYPYAGHPLEPLLLGADGMVDWFFVLSAFLLTLPYATALLAGREGTAPGRFLARRAVRIVPLYLVAVSVVWAGRNADLPGDWRDLLEHLTFTQVFDRERIFFTVGPAWSLAVEMQFYVVLALLGSAATRVAARRGGRTGARLLVGGVAGLAALSATWLLLHGMVLHSPQTAWPVWFGLPAKLLVLSCGMAVAGLVAWRPQPVPRRAVPWVVAGGAALVLAASFTRQHTGGGDALFHSLCGLGFGAVVLGTVSRRGGGAPGRASRALEWTGLVSYSLYLWHEPLLLWLAGLGLLPRPSAAAFPLTAAVLVVTGLLVAWLSHGVVEHPASQLRVRVDGPRRPRVPLPRQRPAAPADQSPAAPTEVGR